MRFPGFFCASALILLTASFCADAQSAADYDAAIREATLRYRGDIPIHRTQEPFQLETMHPQEKRANITSEGSNDLFAPKPLLLENTRE